MILTNIEIMRIGSYADKAHLSFLQ